MFLKYNISKYKQKKRLINVDSININDINEGYYLVKVNTNHFHKLNIGDNLYVECFINETDDYNQLKEMLNNNLDKVVFLTKNNVIDNKEYASGYYELKNNKVTLITNNKKIELFKDRRFSYRFKIDMDDFNEKSFSFSFNKYFNFRVDDVFINDNTVIFHIKEELGYQLNKGDSFKFRKSYSYYKEVTAFENDGDVLYIDIDPSASDYLGYDKVVFNDNLYEWKSGTTEINSFFISDNLFKYSSDMSKEKTVNINEEIKVEDKKTIEIFTYANISIYESYNFLNLSVPLSNENNNNLIDEDISKKYFNEKKEELIPITTDYEKICFIPFYVGDSTKYILNEMQFNLFFRERTDVANFSGIEKWSTNDAMGWFQYKLGQNKTFIKNSNITNGDLLGNLGFTDDDVYYRKNKLRKTFLRFSFYDSKDPLKQQLLFYSTVFLDTTNLYNKYIKNVNSDIITTNGIVNSSDFKDNNLTISFNVYDKYNRDKCSEGYYLYLFPEMVDKTIYMKVEFNHAKYGKTIPLMSMINGSNKMIKSVFGTNTANDTFITSFIDSQKNEINKFYDNLFIPIKLEYDGKNYVYYFNGVTDENYDKTLNKLTINLYEPKINGVD